MFGRSGRRLVASYSTVLVLLCAGWCCLLLYTVYICPADGSTVVATAASRRVGRSVGRSRPRDFDFSCAIPV